MEGLRLRGLGDHVWMQSATGMFRVQELCAQKT